MSFISKISDREPIITSFDDLPADRLPGGFDGRDLILDPVGAFAAAPKPEIKILPRDEWADRIEHMEEYESRLSDLAAAADWEVKHQNGTNFCWGNGVVMSAELRRIAQGLPHVPLSPASVCCPITGFRNQGGYGFNAAKLMIEHGVIPESLWPPNVYGSDAKRNYHTDENWEVAKDYRTLEWWDCDGYDFDLLMTLLIVYRAAPPVGFNWWRHLVTAVDAVVTGPGQFGIRIANSGLGRGPDGWSILQERLAAKFSEMIVPRVILPAA
jgi:hypothetical protein